MRRFWASALLLWYLGQIQIAWDPRSFQNVASIGSIRRGCSPGKDGPRVYFSGVFQPTGFVSGVRRFTIQVRFLIWRIRLRGNDTRSPGIPRLAQSSPANLFIEDSLRHFDKFIAVDGQERFVGE